MGGDRGPVARSENDEPAQRGWPLDVHAMKRLDRWTSQPYSFGLSLCELMCMVELILELDWNWRRVPNGELFNKKARNVSGEAVTAQDLRLSLFVN